MGKRSKTILSLCLSALVQFNLLNNPYNDNMLNHGSLFSGIGGFDLASEWMGWKNVFHCEYDPFCQKVLKHHFPNSKLYKDVRKFDATNYLGRVDILTGGFPCQPFSNAGLRKGTEDERHLWPSMLRIIREVSPKYVVGENVRGLLNWSGGLVFEEVCADLEAEGYEVTPYLLPACGKNAPHRRDRIWFIANATKRNDGRNTRSVPSKEEEERICERNEIPKPIESGEVWNAPDTDSGGLEGTTQKRRDGFNVEWEGEFGDAPDTELLRLEHGTNPEEVGGGQGEMEKEWGEFTQPTEADGESRTTSDTTCVRQRGKGYRVRESKLFNENGKVRNWENFPTQPPICGRDDGLPRKLDGITFPKWRKESIKAYGNAIVPQVAHEIFKAIQKMEDLENQQEEV
jgi:DNA (cytosine-5)-methyltransferase 1